MNEHNKIGTKQTEMSDRRRGLMPPDNQLTDLFELDNLEDQSGDEVVSYEELIDEAVSAQRLVVSRLSDVYVSGAMLTATVPEGRKTTQEKRFDISKLIKWESGDPDLLLAEMRKGRLRCRLSARMGIGKSTRLPFLMASSLDVRVLHVTLSAHTLQQASDYVASRGIGVYRSRWSDRKLASVSCMTYADFNGHMIASERVQLFKSFDVLYFDEGFVETVDVMVAKRFLSVYALADTSIIVASATISTDEADGDGAASNLGQFMYTDTNATVDEIASNPKLTADWICDRTAIFCPTNANVELIRSVCEADGLDVMSLDDASSPEEERVVEKWLLGDATTIRVVALHVKYGIGSNYGTSFALMFPWEQKLKFVGDVVTTELVPMTKAMVVQMMSRTGRGIVDGSGGIVFSKDTVPVQTLTESERIHAFVKLAAGSVVAGRTDYWKCAYEIFPNGLPATVAAQLLKVCLHPRIAAKYLAADGLFASKYVRALNIFSQPDHFLLPSEFADPVGRDKWIKQDVVGSTANVDVPMIADDEIRIILQAISLIADGSISIKRWRPVNTFAMHDGYDSDDGVKDRARTKLRRIVDKPLPAIPTKLVTEVPWSYTRSQIATTRSGGYLDHDRMREALSQWNTALLDYEVTQLSVEQVENAVKEVVEKSVIESPGGSVICEVPNDICRKLNTGSPLNPSQFMQLIRLVRTDCCRFATSRLFDMFSRPWDSFLNSLLESRVVDEVARCGLGTDTYTIVDLLRGRLSTELSAVVASSFVFREAYKRVFRSRPSMDDIMQKVRRGEFDCIAQSRGFLDRVKTLKETVDRVLLFAETAGMFLPGFITNAQRNLPIRGDNYLGYSGDDLKAMPKDWSRALSIASHSRSSSKASLLSR